MQYSIYCECNFERMLNIHPPFVVSVAVLIIDIHKSREVTLYLIKHRIRLMGGFLDIKLINHLTYEF